MLKKFLVVIAALCGGAFGDFGAWVFHYILDANADYITGHKWLVAFVGTAGYFSAILSTTRKYAARAFMACLCLALRAEFSCRPSFTLLLQESLPG